MNKTIIELPKIPTVKFRDLPVLSFFTYIEKESTFGNKKLFLKVHNTLSGLNSMWMDEKHGESCHISPDLDVIEMQVLITAKVKQ